MLLKKTLQRNCGMRNLNELIRASDFLNHDCAFALDPESMLLTDPPHNPFSTASVMNVAFANSVARPLTLQERLAVKADIPDRQVRAITRSGGVSFNHFVGA